MIVVTGAAGQVGSAFIKEIVKTKVEIKAIVTVEDSIESIKEYPIEIIKGDIRDRQFLIEQFNWTKSTTALYSSLDAKVVYPNRAHNFQNDE